jgi:lambda family phage portal protein
MNTEAQLTDTAKRIRDRWNGVAPAAALVARPRRVFKNSFSGVPLSQSISPYQGSNVTNTSADFLGDWRSVDSWLRFDIQRMRARSRQIEKGNPWGRSFQISLCNNVLGHAGFIYKPNVRKDLDDPNSDLDKGANNIIKSARRLFCHKKNFTTQKMSDEQQVDRLLLTRLAFDGEIIVRHIRRFDNEFGFTNQIINPDYLDHNLNRIEPNGNMIKMGVELEKDWKYPVAYWFLKRRPNDYFYNYNMYHTNLYYRVPAEEITHLFLATEDSEMTRGWPWIFAVAVNLFRLGRFEEAALVNATIGASKMGFFKKTIPDGFSGSPDELSEEDEGEIIDECSPGQWVELPWNMEPVPFNPQYPDAELDPFTKSMLRSVSAGLGTSYMGLTGDVSDANFSNLRAAEDDENEQWMNLQAMFIKGWKLPEYDQWIYRSLLTQKVALPISKVDLFNNPSLTGRRWGYINPLDDMKANEIALRLRLVSHTELIEKSGRDRDDVFAKIKRDEDDMKEMEIEPLHDNKFKDQEDEDPDSEEAENRRLEKQQKNKEEKS